MMGDGDSPKSPKDAASQNGIPQGPLIKMGSPALVINHEKDRKPGMSWNEGLGIHGIQHGENPCDQALANKHETEEVLDAILPPKEWTEDGKVWRQKVSSVPATRIDVIALQEQLDLRLRLGQAREAGICPIRRELYSQCFDELIRQVTVNCAERGLLLLRVRDEMKMTIKAYQTLYESATAYGVRKALISEANKTKVETEISELQHHKEELDKTIEELQIQIEAVEKKHAEEMEASEKAHHEQLKGLRKTNIQLKHQLETILTYKKIQTGSGGGTGGTGGFGSGPGTSGGTGFGSGGPS